MLTEATKAKFESLYLGIRHLNIWQAYYSVVFLLRRLAFVAVLVHLDDKPYALVAVILVLNLTFICYVGYVDPHTQSSQRRLEIFNEALL